MKKILIAMFIVMSLVSVVSAMNLVTVSWQPKWDGSRNLTLELYQGTNWDKVCSLGLFSGSCYYVEFYSNDPRDYNLDFSCEGEGCQFFRNIPTETILLANGTKYRYYWSMNIPDNAIPGTYNYSVLATMSDPTDTFVSLQGGAVDRVTILRNDSLHICNESWVCTNWSTCNHGNQTRVCQDINSCGTTISKPATIQTCTICKPQWKCNQWSKCVNGYKTRTCIDYNRCGTNAGKPVTSQRCGGLTIN